MSVASRSAAAEGQARSPRETGWPGLAVVSRYAGDDGVAYTARLLERACAELSSVQPRVVELAPARPGRVAVGERARFASRLLREWTVGPADWWIFNHVHLARAQPWVGWMRRRPYAVLLHGIEAWATPARSATSTALRRAHLRISVSGYTARRTAEAHHGIGPIRGCPLGLLPDHGYDDGNVDRAVLEQVSPRSALIVGRMSAAERYKGHDQLLECWPRLAAMAPDAQLVMVGGGDDIERLRHKAGQLGIERTVLFTGFVSKATLNALFQQVRLFAMPSRGEGFGIVYLEAMRAGLPCIASNVDAASELVVDGRSGWLVDPNDLAMLADRIARLLGDPVSAASLGEAGRQRFLEGYTYECFRDRIDAILTESFTGSF